MLPLTQQERYRALYHARCPHWHPSTSVYETRIGQIIATLPQPPAILDLGCGAGGVLERLSHATHIAVGIDADQPSLVRHRQPLVRLINGTLEHLPFGAATFDLVISSWVLEHLAQPTHVFHEVARILKPHGRFVFLTPNAQNFITRLNRLLPAITQARLVRRLYGRHDRDTFRVQYRANTVAHIHALCQTSGLHPITVASISDPTYLAFTDGLFALSVVAEAHTPPHQFVHLVGECVKGA